MTHLLKPSLFLLFPLFLLSQTPMEMYADHPAFRESSIEHRRFKHEVVEKKVKEMQRYGYEVEQRGVSIEGRPIYMVRVGAGPETVLLWSQMHGDEPTATMAMMDLFNFFMASGDGYDEYREKMKKELSLYFIPMLNPDGAERYQRRNAIGIDLNRDAVRRQCPESRILKNARDELQAKWGFNLHDQSKYYGAGRNECTATFSFLAPAYNYAKDVNPVRKRSMQMIVELNKIVQQFLPGQVGKYDDTFEPRAFGDNIQRWGTSAILIECGGLKDDPEKQLIRRIHFVLFLTAFEAIANERYADETIQSYYAIPNNSRTMYDLIVREAEIEYEGQKFVVDIGFKSNEFQYENKVDFYRRGFIADIGDLSVYSAYQEIGGDGIRAVPGKLYPDLIDNHDALKQRGLKDLYKKGYSDFRMRNRPQRMDRDELPYYMHSSKTKSVENEFQLGKNPSFFIEENGVKKYVIVNGRAFSL